MSLLWASGVALFLAASLVVYLTNADLGRHRRSIERVLSAALGYDVRIGELHVDLALRGASRVDAARVSLVNRDAPGRPTLVELDRLSGAIELWPLLHDRVVVRDLALSGARVPVDVAADGRTGWRRAARSRTARSTPPRVPQIVVDRARLVDARATLGGAGMGRSWELVASSVELSTDPTDSLRLRFAGELDGVPLELEGTISPLAQLVIAGDVRADLRMTAAGAVLGLRGRIAELRKLAGIDATLGVEGDDVAAVTQALGLPSAGRGPFRATAGVRPDEGAVRIEVALDLGELSGAAEGSLDSLFRPRRADVSLSAAGPSLAAAAALGGLPDLPDEAFDVDGRVRWDGFPLTVERLRARVGAHRLEADGTIGAPPAFAGSDLRFESEGPDASFVASRFGLAIPRLPYRVSGRLSGDGAAFDARGVTATLGDHRLELEGRFGRPPALHDTEIAVQASGPGLAALAPLAGIGLPDEPYELSGGLASVDDGLRLDSVAARLGSTRANVSGVVSTRADLAGTRLRFDAAGDDLSRLTWAHGLDLPPVAFRAAGEARVEGDVVRIDRLTGRVGDTDLCVVGRVTRSAGLDGGALTFAASGPRFADLEAFVGTLDLPETSFVASGSIVTTGDAYLVHDALLELDDHELFVDGTIVPRERFAGTRLRAELAGPDLRELGRLSPLRDDLPELPAAPYTASGELSVERGGLDLRAVRVGVGSMRAAVDGRLGAPPGFEASDLVVQLSGPDASVVGAFGTGIDLPALPLHAHGRLRRIADGVLFDGLSIRLGPDRLWLDGSIGEPPRLVGSDFRVRADVQSLAALRWLAEDVPLPDLPLNFAARASGSPLRFRADDLDLRIGTTDLAGYLRLGFEGRPYLEGRLESELATPLALLAPFKAAGPGPVPDDDDGAQPEPDVKRERLFGDEPYELRLLQRLDADIEWNIAALRFGDSGGARLDLALHLEDGHLRVGPFDASGDQIGRLSGGLTLDPAPGGFDLAARLDLAGGRLDLARGAAEPGPLTQLDATIDLRARGASPHQAAASADGQVVISLAGGRVDDKLLAGLSAFGVLRKLLEALSPLRAEHGEASELECAVFVVDVDRGRMKLDPLALRTERVTIVGRGNVDLDSERLELEWAAKPRKGLGVGTTMITNPYIKLGGTLTRPQASVRPVDAVATTGVAVVTGGLSLLGRGMWDRVTAGRDVCAKARKKGSELLAEER